MLADQPQTPAPLLNAEAVRLISAAIDPLGPVDGCKTRPELAKLMTDMGAEFVDHSDGDATIEEFTLYTGDGLITLTYGCTPDLLGLRRSYTLHSYRHEDRKLWEF